MRSSTAYRGLLSLRLPVKVCSTIDETTEAGKNHLNIGSWLQRLFERLSFLPSLETRQACADPALGLQSCDT